MRHQPSLNKEKLRPSPFGLIKLLQNLITILVIDNNIYYPHESLDKEFFHKSDNTTICGWKGEANYYDVIVAENKKPSAAWYYMEPKEKANEIKGMVVFWNGVEVESIKN